MGLALFARRLNMLPRLLPALLLAISASAADLDFYQDVYPFLKANCISCHNKTTTKADLNMETPELMIKGGENGPSIVPGKSAESLVVQASMHANDMEMPPANNKTGAVNLTPAEIAILKQWIDQGAKSSVQQEREMVATRPAAGRMTFLSMIWPRGSLRCRSRMRIERWCSRSHSVRMARGWRAGVSAR
jgi:hypothetical protein